MSSMAPNKCSMGSGVLSNRVPFFRVAGLGRRAVSGLGSLESLANSTGERIADGDWLSRKRSS